MKSENILFTLCSFFITIVIIGLSVQSCRTTRLDKANTISEKKVGVRDSASYSDSLYIARLIETWQDNYTFTVRDFEVVSDSSGNVKSALKREVKAERNRSHVRDSSAVDKSVEHTAVTDSSDVFSNSELVEKKVSEPIAFNIWYFVVPVVVLIVFLFVIKRFYHS